MKIIYATDTGEIMGAWYDSDFFKRMFNTSTPHSILEVDEVDPENVEPCAMIVRSIGRFDSQGRQRFYIRDGGVWERENWEEDRGV